MTTTHFKTEEFWILNAAEGKYREMGIQESQDNFKFQNDSEYRVVNKIIKLDIREDDSE